MNRPFLLFQGSGFSILPVSGGTGSLALMALCGTGSLALMVLVALIALALMALHLAAVEFRPCGAGVMLLKIVHLLDLLGIHEGTELIIVFLPEFEYLVACLELRLDLGFHFSLGHFSGVASFEAALVDVELFGLEGLVCFHESGGSLVSESQFGCNFRSLETCHLFRSGTLACILAPLSLGSLGGKALYSDYGDEQHYSKKLSHSNDVFM